jgi:hypothetical protein
VDAAQGNIAHLALLVQGVAENVEHAREQSRPHRRHQGPVRVVGDHAPGQALGWGQGNTAHVLFVEVGHDLNDDAPVLPRTQNVPNGRQTGDEADIHDAAAHSRNQARITGLTGLLRRGRIFREIRGA